MKVGVRDLRENLASWLDRVQAGDEVIVTERGRPVARLGPVERQSRLEELIAQGRVTPGTKPKSPIDRSRLPKLGGRPTVSDILVEQRRSGRY